MARQALLHEAHEYQPDPDYVCSLADHPEHDREAAPQDAVQHAPCTECGSAKDAYIHTAEASDKSYVLAVAVDEPLAHAEKSSSKK